MTSVDPATRRLAVGLVASNEAEFVALVGLSRPVVADGTAAVLVVPALDREATTSRVARLVGQAPGVVVEAAHEYLRHGHDRSALVGDDPVERGRSLVDALDWLRHPAPEDHRAPGAVPGPAEVLAWLGQERFLPPAAQVPAGSAGRTAVVPLGDGRLLLRTAWGGKLVVFARDRSLTPDLALDGVYDPSFVRFLERNITAGAVVVDVGANVGLFAVRMAQLAGPSGSVLALEADPELHAVLQENLDMNYVGGWARGLALAAYSSRASLTFARTTLFRGNGAIQGMGTTDGHGYSSESYAPITVEAVPLDELLADAGPVDLVKIDVEGAERHVLEGLSTTIDEGRVRTVAIEFVRAVLGQEWEPLCRLLATYRDRNLASFATIGPDGSRLPIELDDAIRVGAYPQLVVDFAAPGA